MNEKPNKMGFIDNMSQTLEKWVKIPVYADKSLQRKSEILHTLTFLSLMMGFAVLTITPFIFDNIPQGISITVGIMVMQALIQFLNRKGHPRAAANLFVASILVFDLVLVIFSGGFQSQYLSSLISITIMGGLILGEMYAFHIAGISIATFLALYYVDLQGLTPAPLVIFTPIAVIMINVINLFLSATVLIMVLVKYEENFGELIKNEQMLENTNIDLKQQVAAREQAEGLLKRSENRLKSALMGSPFPTMLHAENGEILLANTAWVRNTGYRMDDLPLFEDWLEYLFREKSVEVRDLIDQLLTGDGTEKEGIYNLYKQDGEIIKWYLHWTKLPALPNGRTLLLTIATDLTKLANIESALREREETLSIYTLITSDGIWDWDLSTDRMIFDPRYYTMAGYEVDEFPHELEEFRKRIHPDDVEKVFREVDKHLKGETDRFIVEFRFLHKDGGWLWIMGRGKITEQDEYANPIRFVGTHTDISEQKSIEEKLSDYQQQLEHIVEDRTQKLNERITEVERLNAALTNILDDYQVANERLSILGDNLSAANQELESLTFSLSTDLLHPIHQIQKIALKLAENPSKELGKKDAALVQEISASAELANQQIANLLKISQLSQQNLQIESVELGKLVQDVLREFSSEIQGGGIQIRVKELPTCQGDRELLEMVFRNLISNSIRSTAAVKDPEIQIGFQPDQNSERVIIFIQDNGVGFDPKNQDLLFGTFQQLKKNGKQSGTGIGLTLAKLIITKHHGRIWADSEEGKGATFYFDLLSQVSQME